MCKFHATRILRVVDTGEDPATSVQFAYGIRTGRSLPMMFLETDNIKNAP